MAGSSHEAAMALDDPAPLSLRPLPVAKEGLRNLADFIARVNAQPGGFRALTDSDLREQTKACDQGDGMTAQGDVDMADADADTDADEHHAPLADPSAARIDLARNLDIAGNTAMLTLDSLSLLLSKQNPSQAGLSLSQQLREMVGIGTLGADRLDEPSFNESNSRAHTQVAVGWTFMEINKVRDAAQEARLLLEKEIEIETRYWEDVVTVKKAGWLLCRVPYERHSLGVRFGFSEASAEFKSNGFAPMRPGEKGAVELDLGRLGGVSEGLVVTYEKDHRVVGRSTLRRRSSGDASLESRILEARNTIFAQELWHELIREAQTLAACHVRLEEAEISCGIDDRSRMTVRLLPISSCPPADESHPHNAQAEAICESLHLLLINAHRCNEFLRTRPLPPHVSRARGQQPYALLRPVIARMASALAVQACTRYVGKLCKVLRAAGIASSFTLRTPPSALLDPAGGVSSSQVPASQALTRNLLQPRDFVLELSILPKVHLVIRGRTFLLPGISTHYHVVLPPSSPLQAHSAPYAEGYAAIDGLCEYLRIAIARTLTQHICADLLGAYARRDTCVYNVLDCTMRDRHYQDGRTIRRGWHARLQLDDSATTTMIVVSCEVTPESGEPSFSRWCWRPDGDGDSEARPLRAIVATVIDTPPSIAPRRPMASHWPDPRPLPRTDR